MADDESPSTGSPKEPLVTRRRLLQGGAALTAAALTTPWWANAAGAAPRALDNSFGPLSTRNSVKKTNLTLMTWELYEPQEIGAWKKVVAEFEAANPSISVSWTGWPFANYDQNVTAQAQAGKVDADVVMCPPELASTLIVDYGICDAIGDIAKEVGLVPDASHKQYIVDGKLYALGILVVAYVLEYDRRILASGGFDRPPSTPEEWLEYTEKLTIPSKQQYGNYIVNTAAAGADMWIALQNFPLGWGGAWANGPTLTIDSPECIAAMEFWVKIVKASGLAGTAEDIMEKLWDNDQVAMNMDVALGASTLKAAAPKLFPNLRTAPVPWANKKAISRLHTINILKTSSQQAAAQELVKWIVTPKNLWYIDFTNGYPLIPYSNFAGLVPQYEPFLNSLPWKTGFEESNYVGEYNVLGDYVSAYAELGNIVCDQIERAVSGSATVTECLQAAQATAKESLHVPT
jgi:ABC-type glycerol-3-phosphate transport system substrate-binding protein